jgi:hypothetical protein
MIESAVIDFPEPDSPTSARVCPASTERETSFTALADSLSDILNLVVRPVTERSVGTFPPKK